MTSAESYIGSNDFWNTAVTVAATAVMAILAAWATLRSVNPKRRLIWRQHTNSTLLRNTNAATAITVRHGQGSLTEPRLIEILIKNSGRRDVQSSDFANGENSLIFDFGAPVISILDSKVTPSTSAPSVTSHTGSELHLHPGLIAKGQTMQFSILVDGPEHEAQLKVATILETPTRRGSQLEFEKTSRRFIRASQIALLIISMIVITFATVSAMRFIRETSNTVQRNTEGVKDASKAVKEAGDLLTLLRNCRYWDVHDPQRAKKECPKVTAPTQSEN